MTTITRRRFLAGAPPCAVLLAGSAIAGAQARASAAPDDRAARVEALFQPCRRPEAPGASVLVVRAGEVLFRASYGLADVEEHAGATPATNYRLASVTKQFTAMAIMILADRGKLAFQQPLSQFFPGLPQYARKVTLRQMLNHQSGLPDYEDMAPKEAPEVVTSPQQQLADRDVIEFLQKKDRLLFEPGSEYRYSNTGYVVLGLVVEKASGASYPRFLAQNVFGPLGMKATVAHVEGADKVSNRAYGYSKKGGRFVRTDQSPTSATLGDGGVYSSLDDLAKWDQALYGPKLVKRETFQQAITAAPLSSGKPGSYGFGWEIGKYGDWFLMAHHGSTLGFRTYIQRIPDQKFSVVVLMNRTDIDPAELVKKITPIYLGD